MNRKIRFLNLKFFKKKNTKMPCFLFKLRGNYKATLFCFRFSKRFLVSPIELLLFFSLLSDCHSSLFCMEIVVSVSKSRLPQSFGQNTKQDTLPCSNMAQQKSNPRTAIFDVERKALQCCSKHAMGETESHIDTSKTKR